MDRDMLTSRPVQLALAVLGLGLVVAGWTGSRAYRIEPVIPASEPTFASAAALSTSGMSVPVDIGAVVALNLFSPERKAPSVRYRLTGYAEATPAAQPPQPVVIGTFVAAENRSFAFCSVGDSRATVVRVGDRIGGYTVKSIERGSVVFTTPAGERLVINAR
jgi:hypothetical protein